MSPELAIVGTRIWTGPEEGTSAEAIHFGADGTVRGLGTRRTVVRDLPADADLVEAGGRWLVPGFVDAHVHVRAGAAAVLSCDCGGVRTAGELLALIGNRAAAMAEGRLIALRELEPELLRDRVPTRSELDAAAGAHPLTVRLRSLHGWLLNTRALRAAALAERQPDVIVDHGGLLRGRLGALVDRDAVATAVRGWSQERLRLGVVAQLDASVTNAESDVRTLDEWHRSGLLAQRTVALAGVGRHAPSAIGIKVMATAGTNAFRQVCDALRREGPDGRPVAVHCLELEVLGAIIEALEAIPRAARPLLRIEHAARCPPDWLDRIGERGAAIVTHPAFVETHGDRYLADPELTPHDWLYRLRSWQDAGLTLAVGSDAPAGPSAPEAALRAAVTRRTCSGKALGLDEALTVESALAAMTGHAADISGLRGYGRLRLGGPGAAVLLAEDPTATGRLIVDGVVAGGRWVTP